MSCLEILQTEIRAHLDGAGFLRRDRDARALFATDYPQRNPDAPAAKQRLFDNGFSVSEENNLWRIDLTPDRQKTWIGALPHHALPEHIPDELLPLASLCRSLLANGDVSSDNQPWPMIRQTLLLSDSGEKQRLWQTLSAQTAVCKRAYAPLPTAAAYVIILDYFGGRDKPC